MCGTISYAEGKNGMKGESFAVLSNAQLTHYSKYKKIINKKCSIAIKRMRMKESVSYAPENVSRAQMVRSWHVVGELDARGVWYS